MFREKATGPVTFDGTPNSARPFVRREPNVCYTCGKPFPDDAMLPRWMKGVGMRRVCPACIREAAEEADYEQRAADDTQKFGKVMNALQCVAGDGYMPTHVDLWRDVVRDFNGVGGLADFFYNQIMIAADEAPGSRKVLDACKTLVGLAKAAAASMPALGDVTQFTTDELHKQITVRRRLLIVAELIDEVPEIAQAAMRRYPELALSEPVAVCQ